MDKIIFYHAYLVNDYKLVIQEQITKIITSGLYNEASQLYIGLASPNPENVSWVLELIKPFPKFESIIIEDNDEKYLVKLIHKYAQNIDAYWLFFHTKAISNPGENNVMWRYSIDYNLLYRWKDCIKMMEDGADAVGINLRKNTHVGYFPHFSGGCWWVKSSYIKTLDLNYLFDTETLGSANRLLGEFYIGSNHEGNLQSIFECKDEAPYKIETTIAEYIKI